MIVVVAKPAVGEVLALFSDILGSEEKSGGTIRAGRVIALADPGPLVVDATSLVVVELVICLRPVYLKW